MTLRLVVTITAAPGRGSELAQAYSKRAAECRQEPGCEQFDVFHGVGNPDTFVLLERWTDAAALEAHAQLNATRAPVLPELRVGSEREDYEYSRTR